MARLAEHFRSRYGVPGLSVAIAFRGRLLYEDAFGMARLRARLVRQSPEQLVARRIAARHAIDSRANFDRLRVSGTRKHASSGTPDMALALDNLIWDMMRQVSNCGALR